MPKFADGTICRVDSTLDPDAAKNASLHHHADGLVGPVERLDPGAYTVANRPDIPAVYQIRGMWAIPETCLVEVTDED